MGRGVQQSGRPEGARSKDKRATCCAKSLNHYVACSKVFMGLVAEICRENAVVVAVKNVGGAATAVHGHSDQGVGAGPQCGCTLAATCRQRVL